MTDVRSLNEGGMREFTRYLVSLDERGAEAPPLDLLDDEMFLDETPFGAEVGQRLFNSRMEFGTYLADALSGLSETEKELDAGLWAWLALYYFDQTCPPGEDGARHPGKPYRYVPSQDYRYRYRHLVRAAVQMVRWHGEGARVLLSLPLHRHGEIMEQVASRNEFIENPGVIGALDRLYYDVDRECLKKGVTNRNRPGSLKRFVDVVQQLDLTYDLFSMTGREIVSLLPPEFDAWEPRTG
jgi:hypothetical protein